MNPFEDMKRSFSVESEIVVGWKGLLRNARISSIVRPILRALIIRLTHSLSNSSVSTWFIRFTNDPSKSSIAIQFVSVDLLSHVFSVKSIPITLKLYKLYRCSSGFPRHKSRKYAVGSKHKERVGKPKVKNIRLNRRTFLKKSLIAVESLAILTGVSGLYGIFGERYWIQSTTVRLSYRRYPASFAGVRIVQFSDTHIGKYYSLEQMNKVVDLLQRQEPDIICFTGDLFDSRFGEVSDEVIPILSRLQAGMGKFAVLGNHDMRLDSSRVRDVLERSGFTVLVNESRSIERGNGRLQVVGIDEMLHGKPDLPFALQGVKQDDFVLLLAHEPDIADTSLNYPVDLQLSGHSHGGQIRIPLYGSIFTPELGQKYPIGLYTFEGSEFHVYTNRGIGTTLFPIRFNCRPEITVFVLETKLS
ncbi:putative MPP superfamily phosphohydrolase [Paenibacillus sp. V4I7]|nr:putative MPP superfamily phosphohydrolase [Paenibacillus sp. V4I7]